jgi:hypothetical protein
LDTQKKLNIVLLDKIQKLRHAKDISDEAIRKSGIFRRMEAGAAELVERIRKQQ